MDHRRDYTEDIYDPTKGVHSGHDEIDRVASAIRALTLIFDISSLPIPRNWLMEGWYDGPRVALGEAPAIAGTDFIVARAAGSLPFISSSTNYRERD